MLRWSVDVLRDAGCDPVVVVVPQEWVARVRADLPSAVVVAGGDTRQASVARGLDAIDTETVLVHDGARPFVTAALARRVVAGLASAPACVPALPVEETLKRADGGRVAGTVDRAGLMRVQTPQAFVTAVLRAAHARAAHDGFTGTDDAQLVERLGEAVAVVEGEPSNVKLTYPRDFDVAEALARASR